MQTSDAVQFSWEKAMEPNGPLKSAIIEKIKRQFLHYSWKMATGKWMEKPALKMKMFGSHRA